MTQGVLLVCFNTDTCEYHKIAERCVNLILKNLKLEITQQEQKQHFLVAVLLL